MKHYKNEFSDNWPKVVSIKPVMGERGRKDLPPGTKRGENMTPDRHEEHKQHTFDSFCKRAIKYEALNAYRQIRYRRTCEISLSELPEEIMEQLAVYDRYPWEYHSFTAHGTVILIENDLLADALNQLSQENREILLMYWFFEMTDREIADYLHLARKTVNNRRLKSYRLLKELMGGDTDG